MSWSDMAALRNATRAVRGGDGAGRAFCPGGDVKDIIGRLVAYGSDPCDVYYDEAHSLLKELRAAGKR